MKALRMMAVLGLLLVGTMGAAQADYLSSHDKTISLTLAPELIQVSGSTGELTFALQEAVHDQLTSSTGAEVDHYYFWVELNGEKAVGVDPLWCDYD